MVNPEKQNWSGNGNYPSFCKCEFPSVQILTNYRGHIPDLLKCRCGEISNFSKIVNTAAKDQEQEPAGGEEMVDSFVNGGDILMENCQWRWQSHSSNSKSLESESKTFNGFDANNNEEDAYIAANGKDVTFHPTYSQGTSIIKGTKSLDVGMIHYWEVRIITSLTGTDVMFGIGNDQVHLKSFQFHFTSALGKNANSWGLSYNGRIQHKGILKSYGHRFSQGCLVGIYLDRSKGYLEFFLNRQSMGIAFRNIPLDPKVQIYPMVCSTAAKSCVTLVNATSVYDTLQFRSFQSLIKAKPNIIAFIQKELPGFRTLLAKYWFLIVTNHQSNLEKMPQSFPDSSRSERKISPSTTDSFHKDIQMEYFNRILMKAVQNDYRLKRKQKFHPTLDQISDSNDDLCCSSNLPHHHHHEPQQSLYRDFTLSLNHTSKQIALPSNTANGTLGSRNTCNKFKVYELAITANPESQISSASTESTSPSQSKRSESYQEYMHYIL